MDDWNADIAMNEEIAEVLRAQRLEKKIDERATRPRYPSDSKDVPPGYVLRGDGWWYPPPVDKDMAEVLVKLEKKLDRLEKKISS